MFYITQQLIICFVVHFTETHKMFNLNFCLLLPEEEEYYPRLSAKELAQHFEKTIEEAAPSKKIKVSPF